MLLGLYLVREAEWHPSETVDPEQSRWIGTRRWWRFKGTDAQGVNWWVAVTDGSGTTDLPMEARQSELVFKAMIIRQA